jgi:hypothetical protein
VKQIGAFSGPQTTISKTRKAQNFLPVISKTLMEFFIQPFSFLKGDC